MSYTNYNYEYRRNKISEPSQLLAASDIFHPTSDQKYMLGCIFDCNDGRRFRYCEDGGSGMSKATMAQGSAKVDNWMLQVNSSGDDAVVKDTHIKVTLTSTRCYKDDFAEGFFIVADTATPLGDMYKIKSNDETGSGLTPILQIADAGGIREAIPKTALLTIVKSKYKDTLVMPAGAATAIPVGIPLVDITSDYFYWGQTRGYAPLLIDNSDNIVAGDQIGETTSSNVAGGGGIHAVTYPIWGVCVVENTSAQSDQPIIIDLQLE